MKKTILTTSILLALTMSGTGFAVNDDSAIATDGAAAAETSAASNESAGAIIGPAAADNSDATVSNGYNDNSDDDFVDADIEDSLKFSHALNDDSDDDGLDLDVADTLKNFGNDNSDNSFHDDNSYNQDNDINIDVDVALALGDLDASVSGVTTTAGGIGVAGGLYAASNSISNSFAHASGVTVGGQNNSVGSVVEQSVVVQDNLTF